jgi:hypothetical protein
VSIRENTSIEIDEVESTLPNILQGKTRVWPY